MFDTHPYPQRKPLRLQGYDYGQDGLYYVTICVEGKKTVFGTVEESSVHLRKMGELVDALWNSLPKRYPSVQLDEYIIMPNHVHGLLMIADSARYINEQTGRSTPLGPVIRAFKGVTTHDIHHLLHQGFDWQRNYHDHIVRNDPDLNRIRQYILDNPLRWTQKKRAADNDFNR